MEYIATVHSPAWKHLVGLLEEKPSQMLSIRGEREWYLNVLHKDLIFMANLSPKTKKTKPT